MRTLPDHYNDRSTYAHFPMITPLRLQGILTKFDLLTKFDFWMPYINRNTHIVETATACRNVLTNWLDLPVAHAEIFKDITDGYGMYLAPNDTIKHRRDRLLIHEVLFAPGQIDIYARYYFDMTRKLIREKSFAFIGSDVRSVDVVRDVVNLVPVHWVSEHVTPLKAAEDHLSAHTEMEIYLMTARIFESMFLNTIHVNGWNLREQSIRFSRVLFGEIKPRLLEAMKAHSSHSAKPTILNWIGGQNGEAHDFLLRLCGLNTNATVDELAYSVLAAVVASVPDYGHAAAHIINFYLDEERRTQKEHICHLALRIDEESNRLLCGYVLEALRLDPPTPGLYRDVVEETLVDQGPDMPKIRLQRDERVFVNLARANVDSKAFGDNCAFTINPERAHGDYLMFRHGATRILNDDFLLKTMPQVIRAVFSLKNIRRAPGRPGQLKRFTVDWHGAPRKLYVNSKGAITPWPESLVIQYDV